MAMSFDIMYHDDVVKEDISKLSLAYKQRIKETIGRKLIDYPEVFGKPLKKSLKGYRSLRVGDYRVIFRIEDNIVKIFVIQHRSVVYKDITNRT